MVIMVITTGIILIMIIIIIIITRHKDMSLRDTQLQNTHHPSSQNIRRDVQKPITGESARRLMLLPSNKRRIVNASHVSKILHLVLRYSNMKNNTERVKKMVVTSLHLRKHYNFILFGNTKKEGLKLSWILLKI